MTAYVLRNPVPGRIVLVRHGETEWSRSGRHTGRTDVPLTENGELSAVGLAPRLSAEAITRAYSSPLRRATRTAELSCVVTPTLLDELVEWDYGDYEGRTTAEVHKERPDWVLWRDGCPGGEQVSDVGRRADRAIARIVANATRNDVVAVFGHGHMLRVFAARWLDREPADGILLVLDTASISVLGFEHDLRVVRRWNA